jgi:NTP pyrophosphatase (non-canonical NTP hydrolase)
MSDTKELLLIVQEECAEVIQAVSKCERFGIDNHKPGKPKTNREHLEEEVGDLLAMLDLLIEKQIVSFNNVSIAKRAKFDKLKQWSNIQIG